MLNKKGQVSTEYIILIGFLLTVMIPLGIFAFSTYQNNEDKFLSKQAEQVANAIVSEAESIYYQGPPSMSKMKVYFPPNIFDIQINNYELTFRMKTKYGIDDVVIPSRVNLTGSLSKVQGTHLIKIETNGNYVSLSE